MFKSEFQVANMRAAVEVAELFNSARPLLLRLQADCEAELAQIAVAAKQSAYAAQFCPARAAEVYTALAWIALALGFYAEDMPNCNCGMVAHADTCPAVAPAFATLTPSGDTP